MIGIEPFVFPGLRSRVIFGHGTVAQTGAEIERLGRKRALVLSTPNQKADAEALAGRLDALSGGVFAEAAMHTPVEVTEKALSAYEASAGRLRRLARRRLDHRSRQGDRDTDRRRSGGHPDHLRRLGSDRHSRPNGGRREDDETRSYDPSGDGDLRRRSDPQPAAFADGHVGPQRHGACRRGPLRPRPQPDRLADGGRRDPRALSALPAIARNPDDRDARASALYGAWLCGAALGGTSMALHHKLCHMLGGSFDTPHAETHAILLPHTIGFNSAKAADLLAPISQVLGGTPGVVLFDFAASLEAPTKLKDFGLGEAELERAADIAVKNPYWNPRPFDRASLLALLRDAWEGTATAAIGPRL